MSKYIKYKVKDIQLAEWGRREIQLAEAEMPGLMSLRERIWCFKTSKGCKNCRMPSYDNTDRSIN